MLVLCCGLVVPQALPPSKTVLYYKHKVNKIAAGGKITGHRDESVRAVLGEVD